MAISRQSEDDVQKAVGILEKGSDNTARIIGVLKQSVKTVDEIMEKTEKKMEEITELLISNITSSSSVQRQIRITELIGSVGCEHTQITNEAIKKYNSVKEKVRAARRRLRSLADKTKTACEELELYLKGWGNEFDNQEKKFYLQEQLRIMDALMRDSIKILTEAEKIYETAINNIDGVNSSLQEFSRELKKMLDVNSAEHSSWTAKLRGSVYGTAGSVTIGCIVADITTTFGLCSAIGPPITWVASIPIVEGSIAAVSAKLEELEARGESALADVKALKDNIPQLIKALADELNIVSHWKNDADGLKEKLDTLDLDKFARMSLYRRCFEKKVVALRESAEDYLNLPVELFVQEPTERCKFLGHSRQAQEKPL